MAVIITDQNNKAIEPHYFDLIAFSKADGQCTVVPMAHTDPHPGIERGKAVRM